MSVSQNQVNGTLNPADQPRVTIVIPVYNESRYIEQCMKSLLLQDYPPQLLEVLLVDGRSTDDTRQKIAAFAAGDGRFRMLDNPGKTQVKAFNLGIGQAAGDIIVRMDAHAQYAPNYVRCCVETLVRTKAANVGGLWQTQPGGPGLIAKTIVAVNTQRFGIGGARFRVGGQEGPVDTVPFGAFRKEVFSQVGLMNERLTRGEDNEFNSRLRAAGLTVYFNPQIVCTYYARATLRGFLWQMFGNGLYHVLTLMVNRGSCSVRHLIPFAFVMALLTFAIAGIFWHAAWWAGAVVLGLYLLADLAASAKAAATEGWIYLLTLPWMFLLVHLTYGAGTLAGIFCFALPAIWRRNRS